MSNEGQFLLHVLVSCSWFSDFPQGKGIPHRLQRLNSMPCFLLMPDEYPEDPMTNSLSRWKTESESQGFYR